MKKKLLSVLAIVILFSCKTEKKIKKKESETTQIEQTKKTDEWISLFEGSSVEGWRAYNGESLPEKWKIEDGMLSFDTNKKIEAEKSGGSDIVFATQEFDNFELYLEWKIPEGGNSGILYHIKEGKWGIPEISPEYQLLDDLKWEEINNATLEDWQKTGADYAMHVPDPAQKIVKPAMEWNTSRIIFTAEKVEHWLNGKKLLEFVPWSADWEKRKKAGKWKNSPKYGTFKTGYIGIQDHDSPIWFRNMKIKKL